MDFFPCGNSDGSKGYLTQNCNFRVHIQGKDVDIFKKNKEKESLFSSIFSRKRLKRSEMNGKNTNYNILIEQFKNVKQVFSSDDFVGNDDGNHILIHVNGKEYVSVGDEVFSFTTEDQIINLESPSGDEFKFAYAIGKKNTYFLNLIEGRYIVFLSNEYLKSVGFLSENGKTYNPKNNFLPNFYHWGFNVGRESKKLYVKIVEN